MPSELKNGDQVHERSYLIRQFNFDNSKSFVCQDPLPKHTLTRKVTIKLVEHDGKKFIVPACDCKHIERERQIFRHVRHTMPNVPTLQSFHPKYFKSHSQFILKNEQCTEIVENYDNSCKTCGGVMIDAST